MSWIFILLIYTIIVFLFSYWVYKNNYVYYKPLEYTDPETNEKINVHSLYPEFACLDKISFLRIFIGFFFFWIHQILYQYFSCNNADNKIKTAYEKSK